MGYIKGDDIRFYNAGVELTLEMEVTIEVTVETIPTTDKDSGAWKTHTDGDKSWTASGSANLDWDAAENVSQAFADIIAGTAIAIDVGSAGAVKFYSGNGTFVSWSVTGPQGGLGTFSFSIEGTGALAEGTST